MLPDHPRVGTTCSAPCTDKDLTSCESDPACSPCRLSAKTFECLEQGSLRTDLTSTAVTSCLITRMLHRSGTLGSTPCLPLAAPSDCHKVSTAESCQSAGCEWCESAAVGNSCYTEVGTEIWHDDLLSSMSLRWLAACNSSDGSKASACSSSQ